MSVGFPKAGWRGSGRNKINGSIIACMVAQQYRTVDLVRDVLYCGYFGTLIVFGIPSCEISSSWLVDSSVDITDSALKIPDF